MQFPLLCVPVNMQFIIFEVTSEYVKKYCSLLIVCYSTCQLLLLHDRHYPIGVLFDLHGSSASLPWNLTVHFQVVK